MNVKAEPILAVSAPGRLPNAANVPGIATGLAAAAATISLLDLVAGWMLGIDAFVRISEGYPAMVPSTATSILFGAIGAIALQRGWGRAPVFACCAAMLALVALANLHRASIPAPWLPVQPRPGDGMSLATAACSILAALGLLLQTQGGRGAARAAVLVQTLGLSIALIPLLGYLYSAEALFANPLYTRMALQTAAAMTALFLALLLGRPRVGWVGILTASERGSEMARRLMPVHIVGPVAICGLGLYATRHGILNADMGLSITAYVMVFGAMAFAVGSARSTNRAERRAAHAEAMRLESDRARREAELAIARAQKVEALGKLVGGVAHDFNNTLLVIQGNLQLLQEDTDELARATYVREAISATRHAADLTGQLLAYSRKSRLSPRPEVMDDLIEPGLRMFRRLRPPNIGLAAETGAAGAVVEIDVGKFRQALLNILINARDAQRGGGEILVRTSVATRNGGRIDTMADGEGLAEGRYVLVEVLDRGPGMDAGTIGRATEPFFTTKAMGEGTGLGLSVVAGFCRQSGGALDIRNRASGGLAVTMLFPTLEGAVVPARADSPAPPVPASAGRAILVVDDDLQVTRVITTLLRRDGHQVQTAPDAEHALGILAAGPLPDLVLSDISMPGRMQGEELALTIRAMYPAVTVMLMSGRPVHEDPGDPGGEPGVRFLQKPIDFADLRAVLAEIFPT